MSEKTKIEYSPVEAVRNGAANIALSAMAIAAVAGLLPHGGEKRAYVTVEASSYADPAHNDSETQRKEREDHHHQSINEAIRKVASRTKDI